MNREYVRFKIKAELIAQVKQAKPETKNLSDISLVRYALVKLMEK